MVFIITEYGPALPHKSMYSVLSANFAKQKLYFKDMEKPKVEMASTIQIITASLLMFDCI